MDTLHPVMREALAAFAPPAESPDILGYRLRLRVFDWTYQFSDDSSVYARASAELRVLRKMQAELDPEGAIWRAIMPSGHGIPGPVVVTAQDQGASGFAADGKTPTYTVRGLPPLVLAEDFNRLLETHREFLAALNKRLDAIEHGIAKPKQQGGAA